MIQVLQPSLPGTLVDFHWDGVTRPRPSHWGINDTSSLRKARVNGPCSGPNAHAQELIFKSISLIARKFRARQIDSELGLLRPNLLYPSPPVFPKAEQTTCRYQEETSAPRHPSHIATAYPVGANTMATGVFLFWGTLVHAKMCS